MSQIAFFYSFKTEQLPQLVQVAEQKVIIKKNWLGSIKEIINPFGNFVRDNSVETVFQWSGYMYAVLYVYLDEKRGVSWENAELTNSISQNQEASIFLFNSNDASRILPSLENIPSEKELQKFYTEFSEEDLPDSGVAMLEAFTLLKKSLSQLDDGHFLMLEII